MIENLTLQLNIVMPEVFSRASRVSVFSGFPPTDCGNDKLRIFVAEY